MESGVPASIDEYLERVENAEFRAQLERIRQVIREEAPEATEAISYQMPGFRLNGPFIWFAAFKNHCSIFLGEDTQNFAQELKGFRTSKGTIQFKPDHPLPEEWLRRAIRFRYEANKSKKKEIQPSR